MNEDAPSSSRSLGRRALAFAILLVCGWLLLKFVIGFAAAIAGTVIAIVAIVAIIWALRVLL
jgi:hypothetical protein